jgi:hypothetical protein
VDLAKRRRQSDGNAQEPSQLERLPPAAVEDSIEEFASRVLEYEHRSPFVARECQGLGCPRGIEIGREQVFVLEPPEALRRRLFCGRGHRKERKGIAVLPATVKGELRAFPQSLQHVSGTCCHGAASCAQEDGSHYAHNPVVTRGFHANQPGVVGLDSAER